MGKSRKLINQFNTTKDSAFNVDPYPTAFQMVEIFFDKMMQNVYGLNAYTSPDYQDDHFILRLCYANNEMNEKKFTAFCRDINRTLISMSANAKAGLLRLPSIELNKSASGLMADSVDQFVALLHGMSKKYGFGWHDPKNFLDGNGPSLTDIETVLALNRKTPSHPMVIPGSEVKAWLH